MPLKAMPKFGICIQDDSNSVTVAPVMKRVPRSLISARATNKNVTQMATAKARPLMS
jgi:hypothetical protein